VWYVPVCGVLAPFYTAVKKISLRYAALTLVLDMRTGTFLFAKKEHWTRDIQGRHGRMVLNSIWKVLHCPSRMHMSMICGKDNSEGQPRFCRITWYVLLCICIIMRIRMWLILSCANRRILWNGSGRHSSDLSTYFTMHHGRRTWRPRYSNLCTT